MKPTIIVKSHTGPKPKTLGKIVLDGDKLTGSTPGLQEIADVRRARLGSAEAAYDSLLNTFNGYVSFMGAPSAEPCIAVKRSPNGPVLFGPASSFKDS